VVIPEAHEPDCDHLTMACHIALDHGYRPGAGDAERLHLMLHGADPIWWALPDWPWVYVVDAP
jgi:hypothetical protein